MGTVSRLIYELRCCASDEDLYEFQQELLGTILTVEEHRAGCSRVVKRLKKGGNYSGGWGCFRWCLTV